MPHPITDKLAAWYRENARDLPWRRTRDPFRIWVSEIMLQQTRVETVIDYYHRFLAAFPTVQMLADAPEDRLLKLWEGLGYYRRARNLQKAAKVVVRELGGVLPSTSEGWQALPGVGRYTAAAIASIAFGERVAVLDGNVKRVLARLHAIAEPIDQPATEAVLWEEAEALVPAENPGDHNQAMMELGATVCLPRAPLCPTCPLRKLCRAYAEERVSEIPARTPKKKVPHRRAAAAVVRREDGAVLVWKRPVDGLLGGMWELPGGEVEEGADHGDALTAHLERELDVRATPGRVAATAKHAYSHFTLAVTAIEVPLGPKPSWMKNETAPFLVSESTPHIFRVNHRELAWILPGRPFPFALHRAHQKLLESLADPQEGLGL